jgi:hypothetical protein
MLMLIIVIIIIIKLTDQATASTPSAPRVLHADQLVKTIRSSKAGRVKPFA